MEYMNLWPIFAAIMLCSTVAVVAMNRVLNCAMSPENKGTAHTLSAIELGYLLRDGDMGHCVAVLVVDLIQRSIKAPEGTIAEKHTTLYKEQILRSITSYLRTKAEQKTTEIIDLKTLKTPSGVITNIRKVQLFFVKKLHPFVSEIVRDPRHLKKYFSPAGILRVMVDLYSTGVRVSLEQDLKAELIARGLVVTDEARAECAKKMWLGAILGAIGAILLIGTLFWPNGILLASSISVAAVVNAIGLNVLLSVRSYLPFYEEVGIVLQSVARSGVRLTLLRALFGSAQVLFGLAFVIVAALALLVEGLIVYWISGTIAPIQYPLIALVFLALLSIHFFACVMLAFKAITIERTPQPTVAGHIAIRQYKNGLKNLSPISVLNESFSSTEYDERLSMLVSLYGIETLWFLL